MTTSNITILLLVLCATRAQGRVHVSLQPVQVHTRPRAQHVILTVSARTCLHARPQPVQSLSLGELSKLDIVFPCMCIVTALRTREAA